MPNHRKHCQKTFIFPPVTYFGRSNEKTCLKLNWVKGHGDTDVSYTCIIYDTLGIKCSKTKVNNSSVKNNLGFICGMNICIYKVDSYGIYLSRPSLQIWLTGEILVLSRNYAQCIIYDTSNFFHFDG